MWLCNNIIDKISPSYHGPLIAYADMWFPMCCYNILQSPILEFASRDAVAFLVFSFWFAIQLRKLFYRNINYQLFLEISDALVSKKESLSYVVMCLNSFRIIVYGLRRIRVNTLRPRQNAHHFADDVFKCIFNQNISIWIKISLKFVPQGSN